VISEAAKMTENKYTPLYEYLKKQTADDFVLTYEEIEDILGFDLPRSADKAAWWDDDTPHHPREQAEAIRKGGYDSRRVPEGGKVRFRKNSVFGYRDTDRE
jgi:hypothetical protein